MRPMLRSVARWVVQGRPSHGRSPSRAGPTSPADSRTWFRLLCSGQRRFCSETRMMNAITVQSIDPQKDPKTGKRKRPGPDALKLARVPIPQVGDNDVLIKVHAAGVNRPDVLQRMGLYPPPSGHSEIIGLEVSGTVVARGDSVPDPKHEPGLDVGAPVLALTNGGGYAEYCKVPYGQCLPVPENMDMLNAGCVAETFFTVWHNLFQQANIFGQKLKRGDSVLIHGGTSGIGMTAIQLAKAKGITVFATAGSTKKCNACETFGAEAVINYKTEDFAERVHELTGGEGVNLVLDMVAGSYLAKNLESCAIGGRVAVIGSLGGVWSEFSMRDLMRRRLTIGGSTLRARDDNTKANIGAELVSEVWPFFKDGSIQICVDSAFDLADASEAHKLMESSQHIGKIVLKVAD